MTSLAAIRQGVSKWLSSELHAARIEKRTLRAIEDLKTGFSTVVASKLTPLRLRTI